MPIFHDPEEEDQPAAKEGELPQSRPPKSGRWLLRHLKRNWIPWLIWSGIMLGALALAVWLGVHALNNQPLKVQPKTDEDVPIEIPGAGRGGGSRARPTAEVPLTNGAAPQEQAPPGVDPTDWKSYQEYRRGQQQQQQKDDPDAQDHRLFRDLLRQARTTAPDANNTQAQSAAPAPAGQVSPPTPERPPEAAQKPPEPPPQEPAKLVNTCYWPEDGAGYRLLAHLTPIKARILNSVNGDHKGPWIAESVQPTLNWDSTTVLIPKGAYLTGNAFPSEDENQERIYLATNEITMPDDDPHNGGCQITFPEVDVLDQTGQVGIKDKVDHHYPQIFLTAIAISGISAAASFSNSGGGYYSPQDAMRMGVSMGGSQAAQQVLGRYAHRKNTLTLRSGQLIVVFLTTDVTLSAWSKHHHARTI